MRLFKIALPGSDIDSNKPENMAMHSLYPSPKIDTTAQPPHIGNINLDWRTTGIVLPQGTVKVLYSFPHGYNYIPTVFGTYSAEVGGVGAREEGIMAFYLASLGFFVLDADFINVNLKYYSLDLIGDPIPSLNLQVRYYVMAERGHE